MSYIQAVIGGKSKGKADQVAIDLAFGCKNKCLGCYGFKSSQRGNKYFTVQDKEFNYEILADSIDKSQKKGYNIARVGKHCDPGDHLFKLMDVLSCCNAYSFRCVVVSKSLLFYSELLPFLAGNDHTLHMSIGPKTEIAQSEDDRVNTAVRYSRSKVNTSIRWTEDVTSPMRDFVDFHINILPYIVTPMRYSSKELLLGDGAKISSFSFTDGYWRPKFIHKDWEKYMDYVCGEINGEVKCCNCRMEDVI